VRVSTSDNVRLMRTSLSGGPSHLVLEAPRILNFQCARLPSGICVYGQMGSEYYQFFTFDPSDGKRAELSAAKLKKADGFYNWNLSPDGKYLVMCKSQNPYDPPALRIISLTDNTERNIAVSSVKLILGID